MDRDTRLAVPEGVVFRTLHGEAVLLDVEAGTYFGLDEVGTRMWTELTGRDSLGAALEVLLAEYDVPEERLRRDLERFVAELAEHRLIRPLPPAASG